MFFSSSFLPIRALKDLKMIMLLNSLVTWKKHTSVLGLTKVGNLQKYAMKT